MNENEYRVLTDRTIGYLPDGTELRYIECFGNSAWTKPTTAPNGAALCAGSLAIETNAGGKTYFWDEVDGWSEA